MALLCSRAYSVCRSPQAKSGFEHSTQEHEESPETLLVDVAGQARWVCNWHLILATSLQGRDLHNPVFHLDEKNKAERGCILSLGWLALKLSLQLPYCAASVFTAYIQRPRLTCKSPGRTPKPVRHSVSKQHRANSTLGLSLQLAPGLSRASQCWDNDCE